MMKLIDLHTHTTASDGTESPSELVQHAAKIGLVALAVTDHDTTSGLNAATETGHQVGIEVIRGCELGVSTPYGEMHLLALWLPEECAELEKTLAEVRQLRIERNKKMLDRLNKLDMPLNYEDVLRFAGGETVGRPHIASAMLEKGYVKSTKEAFSRFLGRGGLAYVPRTLPTPEEGVTLLAKTGAMVCMAHPGLLACPQEWLLDTIPQLKKCGLQAIEAWHSDHSSADVEFCLHLAETFDLGLSGGSDYHGRAKPSVQLAFGKNNLHLTENILDALKLRKKALA